MSLKKWQKEVTVIVAPKQSAAVALTPGGGLMLLDPPRNPGYKAWVEGDTTIWEFGGTKSKVMYAMERRALCLNFEIVDVKFQKEPEM